MRVEFGCWRFEARKPGNRAPRQAATCHILGQHLHAQNHGHLAVVVGYPGEAPGNTFVPIAYAGSIDGPKVQIHVARLSGTFKAVLVQESKVSCFPKIPTQ
ncbi:hypothetical protein CBA19CS22_06275 [Caballeronia novacaledonica]|uniref:Uncharacterized protein n=1 Tax=Caballeronia novacaledonica TaxID=1544861 RepID=A0ACB5QLN9_9BURK|nr:hypothetical protein CBA19CS22_06275 [Caballeronia novacaledonica]